MALFVIIQRYVLGEAMERLHSEHVSWIEEHAAAGTFLLAGPTEPPGGSVILVEAPSREDVQRAVAEDAFLRNGLVASTEIMEFRPRRGSLRRAPENPLFIAPA